ncbi:MAG: hypothetical protein WCJ51_03700 [Candidatus Moraniibacteriota bacterium]
MLACTGSLPTTGAEYWIPGGGSPSVNTALFYSTSELACAWKCSAGFVVNSGNTGCEVPWCGNDISFNGITYKSIVAEDGKCWLDRNVGAVNVGDYGNYYTFNEANNSSTCPTGFRVPTAGDDTKEWS